MASGEIADDQHAPAGTALYVHLPFCVVKCSYCDFYSVEARGHDQDALVSALLREADRRAPRAPTTVFFGGGTPSLLDESVLRRLFDGLDERTGFRAASTEVTVECNPESLDERKAEALLDLGATRLSIGLQSLDRKTLELFGRPHGPDDGPEAVRAARRAGAEDLSVDVIYASPCQQVDSSLQDLDKVLALEPDHFSAYNLTFEEGTLLYRWREKGTVKQTDEESELELAEGVRRLARSRGFEAYEISNYAKPERHCRHNLNYWHNGAYVGIGPSAVSKLGLRRFGNPRSLERWRAAIDRGEDAAEWSEQPAADLRLAETWWLGLRLAEGVDPSTARTRAGFDGPVDRALPVAEQLVAEGFLTLDGERFRLSDAGRPLADAVARRFFAGAEESSRLESDGASRS